MPELIDVAPGSPEWQAARRLGVTATDIVTITGLSATDSAYALYWRKLQMLPEPGDSDRWRLGRELEPYIARRWCSENHHDLAPSRLWRSSDRPWQLATIDRKTMMDGEPVELKSWADADRARWDDGPPAAVQVQVLWQMDVMGVATGHVGVLFLPSGEFRSHTIDHKGPRLPLAGGYCSDNCQACTDIGALVTVGKDFLARMTDETLGPPSPDGSAATLAALKARYATPVNDKVSVVGRADWDAYHVACDELASAKKFKNQYEAAMREFIGDAGVIEVDGEIVARRTITPVKAHYRKEGTRDCITRIKAKEEDNAVD